MPTHILSRDVPRHQLDRRDFLKILGSAAAGALLTRGCSFKPGTDIKDQAVTQITDLWQRVALAGAKEGAEERVLISAVKDAAQSATDFGWLSKGDAVLIKPALNSGNPYPATTSPEGIRAMVELLREKGAGRVIVSDMSGIEHVKLTPERLKGSSRELMHASGMAQAALEAGAELHFPEEAGWDAFSEYDDGLPIVFSWPVASETVGVSDFQFTLNTGEVVFANSVGMWPNWELNERNTVVVFGDFGNRGLSSEADAVFPVRLDIVADDTPLLLIGPGGEEFNAVGLNWETDSTPCDAGPVLVGAKLNFVGEEAIGEGGLQLVGAIIGMMPNDEFALYDEGDFRIRVLTTGGFSPDGVTGVQPDMYEQFFRVHVNGPDGETVLLAEVGVEYAVAGGTLRVVGLSDLGLKENPDEGVFYDDCYSEDRDNYIDIILVGDEEVARNITFVEIPSLEGGYSAFYNPGGPGPEPFEGVRYTAPGPPDMEPVIIALDDPMRVDRAAP